MFDIIIWLKITQFSSGLLNISFQIFSSISGHVLYGESAGAHLKYFSKRISLFTWGFTEIFICR